MHAKIQAMLKRAPQDGHSPLSRRKLLFVEQHKTGMPPQKDGFEAMLGMETSPCTRCWQKSAFGNVLPAWAGSTFSEKNENMMRLKSCRIRQNVTNIMSHT